MSEPEMLIMALGGLTPTSVALVRRSPLRVAVATDEVSETAGAAEWQESAGPAEWQESVRETVWPVMLESIERNGWQARGKWGVIVDDREDWWVALSDSVVARIRAEMAGNPAIRILGVAHLVDTADVTLMSPGSLN